MSDPARSRRRVWLVLGAGAGGLVGWHPWLPIWSSAAGTWGGILVGGMVGAWLVLLLSLEPPGRLSGPILEQPRRAGGTSLGRRSRLGLLIGCAGLGGMGGWGMAALLGSGESATQVYVGIVVGALLGSTPVLVGASRRLAAHLLLTFALLALLASVWVLFLTLTTHLGTLAELDWQADRHLRGRLWLWRPQGLSSRYIRNLTRLPVNPPAYLLQVPCSVLGAIPVGLSLAPWEPGNLRRRAPVLLLALLTGAVFLGPYLLAVVPSPGSFLDPGPLEPFGGMAQAALLLQALLGCCGAAWVLRNAWRFHRGAGPVRVRQREEPAAAAPEQTG